MRILFLSGCAPAKYNYREPNAYPFYLIKEIATRHETAVLYYNSNDKINIADIDAGLKDVGVKWQKQVRTNRLMILFFSLRYIPKAILLKLGIRFNLKIPQAIVPLQLSVYKKYPDSNFVRDVKEFSPDLVIVFPMQLYFAVRKITRLNIPVEVLCTDSTVLHYTRQLKVVNRIPTSETITKQMLEQSKKLEAAYKTIPANYLFVGEEDKNSFIENSGQTSGSFFIPHHLYSGVGNKHEWINGNGKVNVLIGGDGHTIYAGDEADVIAQEIARSKKPDPEKINFHFLVTRYDKAIDSLQKAGYTVIGKAWAEDYDEYLKQIHVQVFPIILGTGTKAKVLAAMVSGLLCVGTKYAFENICVAPGDYVLYRTPADIPSILEEICRDKSKYEQVAIATREKILSEHSTKKVVDRLLEISTR